MLVSGLRWSEGAGSCTFGSGGDYGGDRASPWTPLGVQGGKLANKRVGTLTLPPLELPGEYGGGNMGGIGVS